MATAAVSNPRDIHQPLQAEHKRHDGKNIATIMTLQEAFVVLQSLIAEVTAQCDQFAKEAGRDKKSEIDNLHNKRESTTYNQLLVDAGLGAVSCAVSLSGQTTMAQAFNQCTQAVDATYSTEVNRNQIQVDRANNASNSIAEANRFAKDSSKNSQQNVERMVEEKHRGISNQNIANG